MPDEAVEGWLRGRDSLTLPIRDANRGVTGDLTSSHEGAQCLKWLRGRDSNPDNVVQSRKK